MNDLSPTDLLLTEELLLLALHDRKGTVAAAHVNLGLGGAVLAELLLRERIRVDETRWRKLVKPRSPRRTNDAILNECLRRIRQAKRPASPQTWITRFAGMSRLRHRVAASLCDRGILRADEQTVLLVFRRSVYPEIDPGPERAVIERLRHAIWSHEKTVEPRTAILASLAHTIGALKPIFGGRELRERRKRLKSLTKGELISRSTADAVDAAQAAVAAAAVIPAIIASSTTAASSG